MAAPVWGFTTLQQQCWGILEGSHNNTHHHPGFKEHLLRTFRITTRPYSSHGTALHRNITNIFAKPLPPWSSQPLLLISTSHHHHHHRTFCISHTLLVFPIFNSHTPIRGGGAVSLSLVCTHGAAAIIADHFLNLGAPGGRQERDTLQHHHDHTFCCLMRFLLLHPLRCCRHEGCSDHTHAVLHLNNAAAVLLPPPLLLMFYRMRDHHFVTNLWWSDAATAAAAAATAAAATAPFAWTNAGLGGGGHHHGHSRGNRRGPMIWGSLQALKAPWRQTKCLLGGQWQARFIGTRRTETVDANEHFDDVFWSQLEFICSYCLALCVCVTTAMRQ